MSTITYLVGSIFFPKLIMDHRVKELRFRMRVLAVLAALNQGRAITVGKLLKR